MADSCVGVTSGGMKQAEDKRYKRASVEEQEAICSAPQ